MYVCMYVCIYICVYTVYVYQCIKYIYMCVRVLYRTCLTGARVRLNRSIFSSSNLARVKGSEKSMPWCRDSIYRGVCIHVYSVCMYICICVYMYKVRYSMARYRRSMRTDTVKQHNIGVQYT